LYPSSFDKAQDRFFDKAQDRFFDKAQDRFFDKLRTGPQDRSFDRLTSWRLSGAMAGLRTGLWSLPQVVRGFKC